MARHTIRVAGENIGVGDPVIISWCNEDTVAMVGIVGWVKRIRAYDEITGEILAKTIGGPCDPELWIEDNRTDEMVKIRRSEIDHISLVDGPWCTPTEIENMVGIVPSIDALYRSMDQDKIDALHCAIDDTLESLGYDEDGKIAARIPILKALAELAPHPR